MPVKIWKHADKNIDIDIMAVKFNCSNNAQYTYKKQLKHTPNLFQKQRNQKWKHSSTSLVVYY